MVKRLSLSILVSNQQSYSNYFALFKHLTKKHYERDDTIMKNNKLTLTVLFILTLSLTLFGCADKSPRISQEEFDKLTPLAKSDFDKLYSNATPYLGQRVSFIAQVFSVPMYSENGITMQVNADPVNYVKNIFVSTTDPNFKVTTSDYLLVDGLVFENIEYELNAPQVLAYNIEVVDAITALYPTIKTIDINQTQNQSGYKLTVEKVELAEKETRVYVSITNETNDSISFYTFNAHMTQNGSQFDEQINHNVDYPEPPYSDILPGITTSGILTFPALKDEPFKIILEGRSNNWDIRIEPFTFEVTGN